MMILGGNYSISRFLSTVPFKMGGRGGSKEDAHCTSIEGDFDVIPVGVGCGQHELELYYTRVVLQLAMLDAVQLIRDVGSANVHLHKLKILAQK